MDSSSDDEPLMGVGGGPGGPERRGRKGSMQDGAAHMLGLITPAHGQGRFRLGRGGPVRRVLGSLNLAPLAIALVVLCLAHFAVPINYDAWTLTKENQFLYGFPNLAASQQHVPNYGLGVFAALMAATIAAVELYLVGGPARRVRAANLCLGLGEALVWTAAATEAGKRWVAEPRPDFLARCLAGASAASEVTHDDVVQCIGKNALLEEGRLSFPSGHSSTSMCVGVFGSLYLLWVTYARFAKPGAKPRQRRQLMQCLFAPCILPVAVGLAITASRVVDHRHSPADVTAGGAMGSLLAALFFYGRTLFDYRVDPDAGLAASLSQPRLQLNPI